MAAGTTPRYKGRWRFRFLERGTRWVLGIVMVVGLALSAWGFAIISDNPSTPWPLDDPLTTAFGLVVTATINGDPDPVPWQLAIGRLIVPAAIAGFTYSAYLSVTLVRQNIRAAECARDHTLVFGPAERVGQFLADDGLADDGLADDGLADDETGDERYLVHLDTGDEPVDSRAIYVEVEPDPFAYRAEFAGSQRRRRMDAGLPLWAVAGAARDAQRIVVSTGSDAVALSALGGLVGALGDAIPSTIIAVENRSVAINKSIDLATEHPARRVDVVCRDNVAASAVAELMTDQVRADGARVPIEDQVVLLSVGTGFSHLVLVHLVNLLVDYELAHGTEECLDLHLVRIGDDPVADRSIDFARHFARFFDFTLHDSMREALAALHLGVEPTTAFVDHGDRDATARTAEEVASVLRATEVLVDLSDYHPTNRRITTVDMVVADRSIRYHGPIRRAQALVDAELTARGIPTPHPSAADIGVLLAELRTVEGCTLRATSHPLDGTVLLPSALLGRLSAVRGDVWSERATVAATLVALRRSGIAVDLADATVDTRPDAAVEMLPDDVESALARAVGHDHLDVVRSMVEEVWTVGFDIVPAGGVAAMPSGEVLEDLARRSHVRWTSQRLAAGERPGPELVDDGVDRRHPDLVPFDELAPATRDEHLRLVVAFIDALGSVDYSLVARTSG